MAWDDIRISVVRDGVEVSTATDEACGSLTSDGVCTTVV